MNLAANALFPGIDGIGQSVSELVRAAARGYVFGSPTDENEARMRLFSHILAIQREKSPPASGKANDGSPNATASK
jgi:hypothetical protein